MTISSVLESRPGRTSMLRPIPHGSATVSSVLLPAGALVAVSVCVAAASLAQSLSPSELTTSEIQPTFRIQAQRNLVVVRVVVRNSKGSPVPTLRKEDFRLFDDGKPQTIAHFAIEAAAGRSPGAVTPVRREVDVEALPETAPALSTPERYLALYFDDLNSAFDELVRAREAADHYLAGNLQPEDRVGIFTSSGSDELDFTDDRGKLHEVLHKLTAHPRVNPRLECPEISDFQADRIVNLEDPDAIAVAADEVVNRCHEEPRDVEARVKMYARQALGQYEMQARFALQGLEQVIRRLGTAPGQRNLTLISSGFMPLGLQFLVGEVADRAVRSGVVISSLDPKGLAVLLRTSDASRQYLPVAPHLQTAIRVLDAGRESAASEVLAELAEATGGEFFHSSNDLDAGFRRTTAAPEVYYVLAFSPQNLKFDGRFHKLKVSLARPGGLRIQARRGYYAPRRPLDAATHEKEEIEQALFSQDELMELPVEVHTQFFKTNDSSAKLSVLTRLDVRQLHFQELEGRNKDNLTFVTALFDRNGNLVAVGQKLIEFRLLDSSLEKLAQSGVTVKTSFDVAPGAYLLRQVVRDSEGAQLSALTRTVEIPF
jgi:VWFA-related protein